MKNRERIPELHKEQLYLGEFKGTIPELAGAEEWINRIERSNREILESYPPERIVTRIVERTEEEPAENGGKRSGSLTLYRTVPLAIAASLIFFLLFPLILGRSGDTPHPLVGEETRIKGSDGFRLYLSQKESSIALVARDRVSEGDVIQISLDQSPGQYGVLFSLDGRGVVTLHFPEEGASGGADACRLPDEGERFLSYGYALDNAPFYERFFLVRSETPIDVENILNTAETLADAKGDKKRARLAVPDNCMVTDLLLLKD